MNARRDADMAAIGNKKWMDMPSEPGKIGAFSAIDLPSGLVAAGRMARDSSGQLFITDVLLLNRDQPFFDKAKEDTRLACERAIRTSA